MLTPNSSLRLESKYFYRDLPTLKMVKFIEAGSQRAGTQTVLAAEAAWDGEPSKQREAIYCVLFTERYYFSRTIDPLL